ncbi:MAG: peptidoglycan DD-metalloendopeptidase family protein [Steroidobacteraceae bacterium]
MRITHAIGVIGLSCVLGAGCASNGRSEPDTYVVRPKDTLYSVAWRHDLDYHDLARWNHIGSDYRISVGQVLVLKPGARAAPAARSAPSAVTHAHEASSTHGSGTSNAGKPAGMPGESMRWYWPTELSTPPRPVPGGGILLLGQQGQAVRAACAGRVVYVGNGLRGYGNLAIIKHGDNLLSAYAHNSELIVHEGQDVAGGEAIGRMGTGPHQIAALYFEIRLNGKPVDPLPYLVDAK